MSVRPVLRWPEPRLSTRCEPVGNWDVAALVADLFETMYAAPGRGLAAPQVGVLRRVFVMDAGWKTGEKTPLAVIDPEILWLSPETCLSAEGCLSISGITAEVTRHCELRLAFRDETGGRQERHLTGAEALIAQHEYDHLDGLVTLDRLAPQERAALEAEYAA
ncbi:peptide deformylase [Litorisediminicola beolgyonensis]|uniref:Peptide deformylase n=1 Tax=Litorisediminicola beolgyonensis TaxID=1173614 RepID=A0ABW3ZE53_9RHOB